MSRGRSPATCTVDKPNRFGNINVLVLRTFANITPGKAILDAHNNEKEKKRGKREIDRRKESTGKEKMVR